MSTPPPTSQSEAVSRDSVNARTRVTDVVARFDAGTLAVCREGSVVALHLGTPTGRVIVTMREKDFVRGARGSHDHHGHPFRSLEEIDRRTELQQDAGATAPKKSEVRP